MHTKWNVFGARPTTLVLGSYDRQKLAGWPGNTYWRYEQHSFVPSDRNSDGERALGVGSSGPPEPQLSGHRTGI